MLECGGCASGHRRPAGKQYHRSMIRSLPLPLAAAACLPYSLPASPHRNAGPSVVGAGATWPQGSHGICGDPAAGPLDHEAGGAHWSGAVQGWYHDGQVLNLTVTVTAFHKGRFQFRICRIAGTGALAAAGGICKGAAGISHRDPTPPLPRCMMQTSPARRHS